MSERAKYISGKVFAVSYQANSAAKEEVKLAAPFTADGLDFGIFIDYPALWRASARSPVLPAAL